MEDLLTSVVFQTLNYIPPQDGLIPFLAAAETIDGNRPLAHLLELKAPKVEIDYWPRWRHCEPDVVLTVADGESKPFKILVEAKFLSGKSSVADESKDVVTDQLGREWVDLMTLFGEDAYAFAVYLTADVGMPRQELQDACFECAEKGYGDSIRKGLCWLSWRTLGLLETAEDDLVIADLRQLMTRLGLRYFEGIGALDVPPDLWAFHKSGLQFDWQAATASANHRTWSYLA